MKRILGVCASVAAVCLSAAAWSDMPAGNPAGSGPTAMQYGGQQGGGQGMGGPGGGRQGGGYHPCKAIAQACKAAGFQKDQANTGKGIFKDCLKPILSGEQVAGVTVKPEEVQACKAKMAEREQGGAGGRGQGQGQQGWQRQGTPGQEPQAQGPQQGPDATPPGPPPAQ